MGLCVGWTDFGWTQLDFASNNRCGLGPLHGIYFGGPNKTEELEGHYNFPVRWYGGMHVGLGNSGWGCRWNNIGLKLIVTETEFIILFFILLYIFKLLHNKELIYIQGTAFTISSFFKPIFNVYTL